MTTILYEHPLNERMRNYLKLEQLFKQSQACLEMNVVVSHQTFFNAFFAIIDTLERNDIRGDLIKDLEKLEQNLVVWSNAPNVDSTALACELKQTIALISQLKNNSPIWLQLKDDKFLSSIKQRFAIQGGNSTFDLPQLQFWLSRSLDTISADMTLWLAKLEKIKDALAITLKFIRLRAEFLNISTESGFFQESGEGISLLRIKLLKSADYFPVVSGNRFRYSIRFMLPCEDAGRRYSNRATSFQLARC